MCPENTSRLLFRDTENQTQKQLNNTENQHEQTELQKRILSLDVPRDTNPRAARNWRGESCAREEHQTATED